MKSEFNNKSNSESGGETIFYKPDDDYLEYITELMQNEEID